MNKNINKSSKSQASISSEPKSQDEKCDYSYPVTVSSTMNVYSDIVKLAYQIHINKERSENQSRPNWLQAE